MSTEASFTTWMAAQADDLRRENEALRARVAESDAKVRRVLELADEVERAQRRIGARNESLVARAIRNAVRGKVTRFTSDGGGDAA